MNRKRLQYWAGALALAQLPMRPIGQLYTRVPPRERRIPNVLWQTWGTTSLGRTHQRYLARFRAQNADWTFELVDNAGCDAFMEEHHRGEPILEVYRNARIGPMRSDIWRYAVLQRHGGVYCDINKMLTQPLDELIAPSDHAVIAAENTTLVNSASPNAAPLPPNAQRLLQYPTLNRLNWCIAVEPGHPFIARTLERIVEAYPKTRGQSFANVKVAVIDFTGPRQFTRAVGDVLQADPATPFTQAGLNFHGHADHNIRYSWVRYLQRPSYRHLPSQVIVD